MKIHASERKRESEEIIVCARHDIKEKKLHNMGVPAAVDSLQAVLNWQPDRNNLKHGSQKPRVVGQ